MDRVPQDTAEEPAGVPELPPFQSRHNSDIHVVPLQSILQPLQRIPFADFRLLRGRTQLDHGGSPQGSEGQLSGESRLPDLLGEQDRTVTRDPPAHLVRSTNIEASDAIGRDVAGSTRLNGVRTESFSLSQSIDEESRRELGSMAEAAPRRPPLSPLQIGALSVMRSRQYGG